MKNYLLTIFTPKNDDNVYESIFTSLSDIINGHELIYDTIGPTLLINFMSDEDKTHIFDHVIDTLFGIADTFILTEINDNDTVMIGELLNNNLIGGTIIDNDDNFTDDDEMEFINFVEMIGLRKKEDKIVNLNVDLILDKINENGMSSLSKEEIEYLKNY
jgi:hypothetical protein